jgi:hypothetical protein
MGVFDHPARSATKQVRIAGEVTSLITMLRSNPNELFLKEILWL